MAAKIAWLSDDTGVSDPRWGAGGYILYLQEEDTNKDGRSILQMIS